MMNKNNETPKVPEGYKQTEVGIIPEDWVLKKLGDILEFIGAGKTNTQNTGLYPLYGSTGLIGLCKRPEYKGIAILVARVGANAGTLNIVNGEYGVSDNTIILRLKEDNHVLFFKNILSMINLNSLVFGSGQPLITGSQLKNINVQCPSNIEQTAIANALSDVDALITELEKLIVKKEAIKTGAMQQLLTGRTRLPQFAKREDGTLKGYKQSELGEIPEDWEVVELGRLLKYEQPTKYIVKSEILSEGVLPVLTAGKSFILGYTNEKNDIYLQLPVIIFDDFTTDSKYVDFPFKVKSSAMKMLKRIDLMTSNYFLYLVLKNIFFQVGDHKRHWISDFQRLLVGIPKDIEERNLIAEIVLDMDSEIEALEKHLDKTKALKQGMMQELLTGRTRLV